MIERATIRTKLQQKPTFNLESLPLELLELILSHLPPRNLLLIQHTSRTIHLLISTSPTLQRKLYFLPPSGYNPSVPTIIDPRTVTFNPLLFPNLKDTTLTQQNDAREGVDLQLSNTRRTRFHLRNAKLKPHWTPSPLPRSRFSSSCGKSLELELEPEYCSANLSLLLATSSTSQSLVASPVSPMSKYPIIQHSWERMYLTSPPLPISISICSSSSGNSRGMRDRRKVKGEVVRDGWSGVLGPALEGLVGEIGGERVYR